MNFIKTLNTDFIRPSRTIETVLVSNPKLEKIFYVYNYEGYSFRLFNSLLCLINFFEANDCVSYRHFESEDELDIFLANYIE
jgi:hypothetical protein